MLSKEIRRLVVLLSTRWYAACFIIVKQHNHKRTDQGRWIRMDLKLLIEFHAPGRAEKQDAYARGVQMESNEVNVLCTPKSR